ncbi:MAG: TetR/AcrR family transcriptional regulator, partial [Proteobacteria bacterium]|nr:TetR/AcrR family transcriptional regulator [Pseudomonadota bacterium]
MTAVKKKELLDHLVKTQIVDAVMTMIKKNSSITMDGIARTCGIAKGSLYNYFKNKEDLMGYVHQAILEPIRESKSMILDSRKDPLTRLYEFIDSVFHINEDLHFYFR